MNNEPKMLTLVSEQRVDEWDICFYQELMLHDVGARACKATVPHSNDMYICKYFTCCNFEGIGLNIKV